MVRSRIESDAFWTQQHTERADQLFHLLRTELADLREEESQRGHAAVDRLGELQTALARHLTTLGTALEQPITRLLESASEAPRAAAEVIGQLRQGNIQQLRARQRTAGRAQSHHEHIELPAGGD